MIRTGNERTGNRLLDIPVKGGEELTEATMAVINAEGYAETATAAAGLLIAAFGMGMLWRIVKQFYYPKNIRNR